MLLSNDSDDVASYDTWHMVPGEQDDATSDLPPEVRATCTTCRDDRQGVDWWWMHVQVQ